MPSNLLLVFVHGFKGGQDSFNELPCHLQSSLQSSYPGLRIHVKYFVFPTHGSFPAAVTSLRTWFESEVIDIETSSNTPSAMAHPSVQTIFICHSMGGLVAADLAIEMYTEANHHKLPSEIARPWPVVAGILAFDTPYLGVHPQVFARNIWQHGSQAYNTYQSISSVASGLGKWGAMAVTAAVASGSAAAAIMNKGQLSTGWTWAQDHLNFVSILFKGSELTTRLNTLCQLPHLQFICLYTTLSTAAPSTTSLLPDRTFCVLPDRPEIRSHFHPLPNHLAQDEIQAHVGMFSPKSNSDYYPMADKTLGLIRSLLKSLE